MSCAHTIVLGPSDRQLVGESFEGAVEGHSFEEHAMFGVIRDYEEKENSGERET